MSEDKLLDSIVPFYPIYARAPNVLLRYEERPFELPNGCSGIERVAIFLVRGKGEEQEMTAQILWRNI
jgi:hypothetical protein